MPLWEGPVGVCLALAKRAPRPPCAYKAPAPAASSHVSRSHRAHAHSTRTKSIMRIPSVLLLLLLPLLAAAANDVIVADLKIFVNNYEFVVKGISYNPVPLGVVDGYVPPPRGGGAPAD